MRRLFPSGVLSTSSALLAVPFTAVVLTLHFALRDQAWRREWLWAFDSLAFSVMLTGPVLAGVAAWDGARWSRCRSLVTIAERAGGAIARPVLAMWAWTLGLHALVIAALVAVVWAGPITTPPPAAALTTIVPLLAMLFAEIVIGFAIGWHLRRGVIAPLVAVATFVVTLVGYTGEPGLFVEIGGATGSLLGLAPRPALQAAQSVFWSGVAFTVVAAITWSVDRRRRLPLLVGGVVAGCTTVVAVVIIGLGTMRFREVAVEAECTGLRPELCLADGYDDLRPRLTSQLTALYATLAGSGIELPPKVEQVPSGSGVGDALYLGAIHDVTTVDIVAMVLGSIAPPDCDVFANQAVFQAYADIAYWLTAELGDARYDPTVSPELTGGDRTAALDVVRRQVATLQRCGT